MKRKIENVSLKDLVVYQSVKESDFYIIWDKKNDLYHFFNNWLGILAVSGNYELYVGSTFSRKNLIRIVKNVYTNRKWIRDNECSYFRIWDTYDQDGMKNSINNIQSETPYRIFDNEGMPG